MSSIKCLTTWKCAMTFHAELGNLFILYICCCCCCSSLDDVRLSNWSIFFRIVCLQSWWIHFHWFLHCIIIECICAWQNRSPALDAYLVVSSQWTLFICHLPWTTKKKNEKENNITHSHTRRTVLAHQSSCKVKWRRLGSVFDGNIYYLLNVR